MDAEHGETEILIEATIVGKVRVQKVSALAALHPRIGLVIGVDLNPIDGSLHSGKARPDEYWLTELRGNLYLSENGPSIGSVHWIGAHCEIRSQPYPSESQLQLACDLDPGTLERLETARGGNDLALWIELWPRIEHPGGYLSASIRGFRLAVARVEWLRFLEGVGYGTYELMELRIPKENAELTHRSIDGIREAQHRLWLGDHGGALAEARKVIEALESLAPEKKLEPLLSGYHATRAKAYAGIASRLKKIASAAVHDYGRGEVFSREEVRRLGLTCENVPAFAVHLDASVEVPELGTVTVDVAYGGMFYVMADAQPLGLALTADEAGDAVRVGEMIKAATQEQLDCVHPDNPEIRGVTIAQLSAPAIGPDADRRNTVIVSTGKLDWDRPSTWKGVLDRSPCGTGTCAKMAALHAKGELPLERDFRHEGILGTIFTGRLLRETRVGGLRCRGSDAHRHGMDHGLRTIRGRSGRPVSERLHCRRHLELPGRVTERTVVHDLPRSGRPRPASPLRVHRVRDGGRGARVSLAQARLDSHPLSSGGRGSSFRDGYVL